MADKKRKRKQNLTADTGADVMDVFRQHFESRFAPLKRTSRQQAPLRDLGNDERVSEKERMEISGRPGQQAKKGNG